MKKLYKYLLVILWMGIIFLFSNQLATSSSLQSGAIVHVLENLHVSLSEQLLTFLTRKAAHTFLYLVLGVLIYNIVREYKFSTRRAVLLSIGLAFIYAASDETHQIFVSGRSAEPRDVLIDTMGAALGVGAYYLVHKIRSTRKTAENKL